MAKKRRKAKEVDSVLLLESPLTTRHLGLASDRRQAPVLEPLLRSLGYRVYQGQFLLDFDLAALLRQASNRKLSVDIVHVTSHGLADALVPAGMSYMPLTEEDLEVEGFEVEPIRQGGVLIKKGRYREAVVPLLNVLNPEEGPRPLEGKIVIFSACNFINEKTGPFLKKASGARLIIGYDKVAYDKYCNIMEPLLYYFLAGRRRARIGSYVKKIHKAMGQLGLDAPFQVY